MENILDEYSSQSVSKELYESIKWWESRRIFYNIAVGIAGLIPIAILYDSILQIGFFNSIIGIVIYAILVNICYCFGWGIDILKSFYLENPSYGKSKLTLLVLGVIFSMWFTLTITWFFLVPSYQQYY
jgi:poly(A) polymerase Pap1